MVPCCMVSRRSRKSRGGSAIGEGRVGSIWNGSPTGGYVWSEVVVSSTSVRWRGGPASGGEGGGEEGGKRAEVWSMSMG
jgi:hypothetical protein